MRPPTRDERIAAMAEGDRRRREQRVRRERRRRVTWLVVMWVAFVVPGLVMTWFILGWIMAIVFAVLLGWTSWDYYQRGGMVDAIESSQRAGAWLPSMFTRDDRGR